MAIHSRLGKVLRVLIRTHKYTSPIQGYIQAFFPSLVLEWMDVVFNLQKQQLYINGLGTFVKSMPCSAIVTWLEQTYRPVGPSAAY